MSEPTKIYEETFSAGSQYYHINVKKTQDAGPCIEIATTSQQREANGGLYRENIVIFEEAIPEFDRIIKEALEAYHNPEKTS
jgi:hypothetical protein